MKHDNINKQAMLVKLAVGNYGQMGVPKTYSPGVATTPPSVVYPNAQPQADHAALFRRNHGTDFDPNSRIDRVKMQKLRMAK